MDADRIALLLPEVYRETVQPGSPLAALLDVMAAMHAPVEDVVEHFDAVVDPYRTPEAFVPVLAAWVDLARWLDPQRGELSTGSGRLRVLVARSAEVSRLRGTARGLRLALTLALGLPGVRVEDDVVDEAGRPVPFVVRVTLPAAAREHADLVEWVVRQEKAAHVRAEVRYLDDAPAGHGAGDGADPGPDVAGGPAPGEGAGA